MTALCAHEPTPDGTRCRWCGLASEVDDPVEAAAELAARYEAAVLAAALRASRQEAI
jgi:hypothetical protein